MGIIMNKKMIKSSLALAIAAATAFGTAHAVQLEEIIVTAQKRAESLQDIPISITTIQW